MILRLLLGAYLAISSCVVAYSGVSIPFPGPGLTSVANATISKTDTEAQVASLTSFTFTGKSTGSAVTGRRVIVGVTLAQSGPPTITSVTIDGNAMTSVVDSSNGSNIRSAFFIRQVDTGTTGTIVVNVSGVVGQIAITVHKAVGLLSSTATNTYTSSANPMTDSVNVTAGGVGVAILADVNFTGASTPTHTWAGFTEDYDAAMNVAIFAAYSAASAAFATTQTGLTVSATPNVSPTEGQFMAVAAFR